MSKLAVYPGSFDPFTLGHLDVAKRAAELFDEVQIVVVHNPSKTPAFELGDRAAILIDALQDEGLRNVTVRQLPSGLLTEYCSSVGANVIVKGLRNGSDVSSELPQAFVNRDLGKIETVFLPSDPALSFISSTLVRQVAELGGDISSYVPKSIAEIYGRRWRND
jgi:pantetheine-phosphate adenylyltransferase